VNRCANPIWLEPKGTEVERFTGEPGLVVKYNLLAEGMGKPERLEGANVPFSLFQLRNQKMQDFEALAGTFDVLRGAKPSGVEAFSALQLLVERAQSRFASAFIARGQLYRDWFKVALELERQFGPEQRSKAVLTPNRSWAWQQFQNANLQGAVSIVIEDGTNTPKTSLGKRAAIQQAANLKVINPADPEQRYAILNLFGLTSLIPGMNAQVQAALQLFDAFERWVQTQGQNGPMPLIPQPWHNPAIHLSEFDKWANSDRMRLLIQQFPPVGQIMANYRKLLMMELQPPPIPGTAPPASAPAARPPKARNAPGMALQNSNVESSRLTTLPGGQGEGAQNRGPE